MNWIVTIRPKAKADLHHAYDWYEEQCVGLGDEFLADHAEAMLRLESDPERFPIYYRGFRRVLPRRFHIKSFSASWSKTSSSFAFCTARKIIRANCVSKNTSRALISFHPSSFFLHTLQNVRRVFQS